MTRVKICGITNLEDARHAVDCGADALGFNFYKPSPRYIIPQAARSIITQLEGSTDYIGVFVNEPISSIAEIADDADLNMMQLHGDENPDYIKECATRTSLPVIKAFRVGPTFTTRLIDEFETFAILLDAYCRDEIGGTGKVFDWNTARDISSVVPRLYLAGGLSAENVAEAIKAVKPYAVDACSLLEARPGIKDPDKVSKFIAAVKTVI